PDPNPSIGRWVRACRRVRDPQREREVRVRPGGRGGERGRGTREAFDSGTSQVIPSAFIAAVIGSEKNTGATLSTMSPETARRLRLFSRGIRARRAPLSIATWSGSARDRTDLMFPWMLRSPRITSPAWTDCRLTAEYTATTNAIPASHG